MKKLYPPPHSAMLLKVVAIAAAIAVPATTLSAATVQYYWAEDVSQTEGWVDMTQQTNDLCGPTTAMNMIYWWQNQLSKKYVLPENCPRTEYELLAWVYDNCNYSSFPNAILIKYIEEVYSAGVRALACPDLEKYNYGIFYQSTKVSVVLDCLFRDTLTHGYPVGWGSLNHAMTLWGVEVIDGVPTRAWCTNSGVSAKDDDLEEWNIVMPEGDTGFIVFKREEDNGASVWQAEFASACFLIHDADFSPYLTLIPEPSAFPWLAGAGTLALVAARRRRRRMK